MRKLWNIFGCVCFVVSCISIPGAIFVSVAIGQTPAEQVTEAAYTWVAGLMVTGLVTAIPGFIWEYGWGRD